MSIHQLLSPTFQTLRTLTFNLPFRAQIGCVNIQKRHFAKPSSGIPSLGKKSSKIKGAGPIAEKKKLSVETDANKLANYLCGSCLTKTGEEIKLKDDSEYPDWLWTLNTGKPPPLEELDPDTEYYWIRVKKLANRRALRLQKLKKF